MANYPNHHLIIGGYFSTWAFNLVMSEVLREFNKLYKESIFFLNKIMLFLITLGLMALGYLVTVIALIYTEYLQNKQRNHE